MLLRAVAVYAILAVVVSVPDIINEGESDEIDLSSSSEDDEDAHVSAEVIALSSDEDDGDAQAPAEEGDKSLFVVEAGKRCPSCGLFDQETDTNTNVSVCMACYLDYSGTSPFKTGETAQEAAAAAAPAPAWHTRKSV